MWKKKKYNLQFLQNSAKFYNKNVIKKHYTENEKGKRKGERLERAVEKKKVGLKIIEKLRVAKQNNLNLGKNIYTK